MLPEDKHNLARYYYKTEDGEMHEIDAAVTEIQVEPTYDLMGVDWGQSEASINATFTHNVRTLSPTLSKHFKRVTMLGHVYIDDIKNLF